MNRFREAAGCVLQEAREALRLAPLEIVLGFALAVRFSWTIEESGNEAWRAWFRFLLAFFPAWIIVFSATTLERLGAIKVVARWILSAVGLVVAWCYHAHLESLERIAEIWRFGILLAGLLSVATVLPLAARESIAGRRYLQWQFTFRLTERLAQTAFFCFVLYTGLAGALGAIHGLFELDVHEELYAHVFSLTTLALGPWLIAAGIPWLCELKDLPLAQPEPDRLSRTLAYLIVPLGLIYLAILFAYYAKVLVTGELPKNLLSPLALGAGFIGLTGVFALEPFRDRENFPLLAGFQKWFSLTYLPLVPLAGWAIAIRVGHYGWTEFRYLRALLLGIFTLIALAQTLRVFQKKTVLPALVPAALGAALIGASLGPWGIISVSEQSQRTRLLDALSQAGVGLPIDYSKHAENPRQIDNELYKEITSGLRYLQEHHGKESLAGIVIGEMKPQVRAGQALKPLPVQPDSPQCNDNIFALRMDERSGFRTLSGGRLYKFNAQQGRRPPVDDYFVALEGNVLELRGAEHVLIGSADLSRIINEETLGMRCSAYDEQVLPEALSYFELTNDAQELIGSVSFENVGIYRYKRPPQQQTEDDQFTPWRIQHVRGFLVVKEGASPQ